MLYFNNYDRNLDGLCYSVNGKESCYCENGIRGKFCEYLESGRNEIVSTCKNYTCSYGFSIKNLFLVKKIGE